MSKTANASLSLIPLNRNIEIKTASAEFNGQFTIQLADNNNQKRATTTSSWQFRRLSVAPLLSRTPLNRESQSSEFIKRSSERRPEGSTVALGEESGRKRKYPSRFSQTDRRLIGEKQKFCL
ncbi:hypothetical protein K0M31_013714 [Melipona bicolor]|uniref:Uncharacterized protein n=1 Tax=Melipona bicolor TaxID=60889 RepID=A0AA40FHA6_9HYME|nr:hypothetical protein K0M31_013714 [Melipona bicolor]